MYVDVPCRMIAAQSPLPQTVDQFLQMVQEYGVSVIVTLTREEEQDDNGTYRARQNVCPRLRDSVAALMASSRNLGQAF